MRGALLLAVLIPSGIVQASIIHVPAEQATIQQALDIATTGDTILVQPGTYFENLIWPNAQDLKLLAVGDTSNTIVDGGGIDRVLSMQVTVSTATVIRGFRFTNGSTMAWYGAGIYLNDSSPSLEQILVDNCHVTGDRSYGAGIAILGGSPEIRSSTIRNNNGQISNGSYSYGGGLYVSQFATVKLDSVTFHGNLAASDSWAYGGGLYATNSSITMDHCTLTANNLGGHTWSSGGGLFATNSAVIMNYCILTTNNLVSGTWAHGGGLYAANSSLTMNHCILTGNILGGEDRHSGGGAFLDETTALISHCSFTGNELHDGSRNSGGGLCANSNSIVHVDHCQFVANVLDSSTYAIGGGIYVSGAQLNLRDSEVSANRMTSDTYSFGNGIFMEDGIAFIENTLICQNGRDGSGSHCRGGGLYADNAICTVVHSTIADNYRTGDDTSILGSGAYVIFGVLIMRSNICWNPGSSEEIYLSLNSAADITYSDVRGSWPGLGNTVTDPGFAGFNDYHLSPTSPCIGLADMAGYPILDIEGQQRPAPIGTAPDMGAYEEQASYTGLSTTAESPVFVVRPVPFNDHMIIETRDPVHSIVTAMDAQGRVKEVAAMSGSALVIDTQNWSAGLYLLRIQMGDRLFHQRAIKD